MHLCNLFPAPHPSHRSHPCLWSSPTLPPQRPENFWCTFCHYRKFTFCRILYGIIQYVLSYLVSFIQLIVLSPPCSWRYWQSIPFYCWIAFHCVDTSFMYLLVSIWIVFILGNYKIIPPQTFIYKSLCDYISSFILDKHLEMEWLSHVVGVCLTFSETAKLFSTVDVPFTFIQ